MAAMLANAPRQTVGRSMGLATFFAGIGLTSHTQFRVLYAQTRELANVGRGFGAGATRFQIASAFNL